MYVKVAYIMTKCHTNWCGIVKKMTLCDKMTKKSGGGTPGLSISDKLFKYDRGTGTYIGKGTSFSLPLMILYYV